MSNIALRGDVIQDLGEYLPNPYIESIQVEESAASSSKLSVTVFYSLIFLINDDYSAEDISQNLQDINIIFAFTRSNRSSPENKKEIIKAINLEVIRIDNGNLNQVDMSGIFEKINNGDYTDDLYDEKGRRIFKINATYQQELAKSSYREYNTHCYTFSSILSAQELETSEQNIAYLNTGNFAYEKIMSPGLNILREEEVIYIGSQGEKYGQVPILGLNRNFYKTQAVSRENIISKVNSLIRRFEGRSIGPLTDSVNSIKAVLSKEADTENLLVQLDRIRRSFPSKTNNNPVGNLHAALTVLLQNINSAFRPVDIVKKQKYLTGKVLDLRTGLDFGLDIPPPAGTIDYIPENMFFIHRERLSTDETSDIATNNGVFFIRYEERLKRQSNISSLISIEKLLETVSSGDFNDLRRILFSYFRLNSISLTKYFKDETGYVQRASRRYGYDRSNRSPSPVAFLSYGANSVIANVEPPVTQIFREYNFGFDDPKERLLCFQFRDIDSYTATFELNEIETVGSMNFRYEVTATIYDETQNFVLKLIDKYDAIHEQLKQYVDLAEEVCSYNNIDNRFNDFFVQAIREEFPDGVYPWEIGPSIYSMMVYILTRQFSTFEDVVRYSKNVSATISPENGNLRSLVNFRDLMNDLKTTQINNLRLALADQRSFFHILSMEKEASLLPFNFVDLTREANAEFESLVSGTNIRLYPADRYDTQTSENPITNLENTNTVDGNGFYTLLMGLCMSYFDSGFNIISGMEPTTAPAVNSIDQFRQYTARYDAARWPEATREIYNAFADVISGLSSYFKSKRNAILQSRGLGYTFTFRPGTDRVMDEVIVAGLYQVFVDKLTQATEFTFSDYTSNLFSKTLANEDTFNALANIILDYYRLNTDKLMWDINASGIALAAGTLGSDYYTAFSVGIWTEIFDSATTFSISADYTGPDITEIEGFEDISF